MRKSMTISANTSTTLKDKLEGRVPSYSKNTAAKTNKLKNLNNLNIKPTKRLQLSQLKHKIKPFPVVIFVLLLAFILVGAYLYNSAYNNMKAMGLNTTPIEVLNFLFKNRTELKNCTSGIDCNIKTTSEKEPELQKDSTGVYTNVLFVGIDTRPNDGSLFNTDSIIVASYNYTNNQTSLISIPRDTAVQIPEQNWYNKINAIYIIGEQQSQNSGMTLLKKAVESYTGLEIQYYVMIDLDGFRKVIDAVDGIDINVDNTFTDYNYPSSNAAIDQGIIHFDAGPQHMDGYTALIFARSRHSMDNGEGSDFARAKRQQKIIQAFVNKLMSSETYTNPQKILEIAGIVQDNVKLSGFTIDELEAAINLGKKVKDNPVYSFVLDPTIADFTILTEDRAIPELGYVITPVLGLNDYSEIRKYVQNIVTSAGLASENPAIFVYDTGTGYTEAYNKMLELKNMFPFANIQFMGSLENKTSGTILCTYQDSGYTESMKLLTEKISPTSTDKPEFAISAIYGENISVFIGASPETSRTEASAN